MRHSLGNDLTLGKDSETGERVILPAEARRTHLYTSGLTESGKSKLLESLAWQDLMSWHETGCGMLVIDPHGGLYKGLMERLAWHDRPYMPKLPIIPIDLSRNDWTITYNVLRPRPNADPAVIVAQFVRAMAFVWGAPNTDETPLFARCAAHVLRTLYEKQFTLLEAEELTNIVSKELRRAMTAGLANRSGEQFWQFTDTLSFKDFDSQFSSTLNRLQRFLNTAVMRRMFGQQGPSLDFGEVLKRGHIVLVNLSTERGQVDDDDAKLFATILLADLWTAARERGKPSDARDVRPFYIYLDEFQRFVTPTIAQNLAEARGYGLNLTLAHQYPQQLLHEGPHGEQILDAVMATARNKAVFAMDDEENLKRLALSLFRGTMSPDKVKLALYSTKVLSYREETRTSYHEGRTQSHSSSNQSGRAGGRGQGGTRNFPGLTSVLPTSRSRSQSAFASHSESHSSSWADAHVSGETTSSLLIPEMGKELSSVQFESLEEQLFRAMGKLHDQAQRHFVTRLVGSRIPRSVRTPNVEPTPVSKERVEKFTQKLLNRVEFARLRGEADRAIERNRKKVVALLEAPTDEAEIAKRPVRRPTVA
jgi:hypothetical protein